ncbi:MAG: hypothetical protein ABIP95_04825 [Pelobium sp.]
MRMFVGFKFHAKKRKKRKESEARLWNYISFAKILCALCVKYDCSLKEKEEEQRNAKLSCPMISFAENLCALCVKYNCSRKEKEEAQRTQS